MSGQITKGSAGPAVDFTSVSDVIDGLGAVALAGTAVMLTSTPPQLGFQTHALGTGVDDDGFPVNLALRHELPLHGLTVESFFEPLLRISGQSLPTMSLAFDAAATYSTHLDDHAAHVQQAVNSLFQSWKGDAQVACSKYAADYVEFVNSQRDMCLRLIEIYIAYAGVIKAARDDMAKNVDHFLGAVNALLVPVDDGSETTFLTTLFVAVVGAAATIVAGPAGAVAAGALISLATAAVTAGASKIIADSYKNVGTLADCASAYFKTAKQILDGMANGIGEIAAKADFIIANAPTPPKSPLTRASVDKDHHQLEPQAG